MYTYLNAEDTDLTKKVHLLFVLFEQIGIALNQERVVDKIRNTYLKYGPYGDITYIHSLVKSTDYYYSDDKDGIEILDDIRKHKDICIGTVSEMGKELLELKRLRIGYIRGCKTTHCLQKLEYMTRNLLNVVIYKDIFYINF